MEEKTLTKSGKNEQKICEKHESVLKYFCIDDECKISNKICCSDCLISDHLVQGKIHKNISIKEFIKEIKQIKKSNSGTIDQIIDGYQEIRTIQATMDSKIDETFTAESEQIQLDLKKSKNQIIANNDESGFKELINEVDSFLQTVDLVKIINSQDIEYEIFNYPEATLKKILNFYAKNDSKFFEKFSLRLVFFIERNKDVLDFKLASIKGFFNKLRNENLNFKSEIFNDNKLHFLNSLKSLAYCKFKNNSYQEIYANISQNFVCQNFFYRIKNILEINNFESYLYIMQSFYQDLENKYPLCFTKILLGVAKVLIMDWRHYKNFLIFNRIVEEKYKDKLQNYIYGSQIYYEITKFNKQMKKGINKKNIGPIVFITPEIGKWSSIGGLGKMVDMLSIALNEQLNINQCNCEIYIISLCYREMATQDILQSQEFYVEGTRYVDNIRNESSNGIQYNSLSKKINRINYVFIDFYYSSIICVKPYIFLDQKNSYNGPQLFTFCAVDYLKKKKLFPSLIITNDYLSLSFASFIRRDKFFLKFQPKIFHICHLLENFSIHGYCAYYNYSDLLNSNYLSNRSIHENYWPISYPDFEFGYQNLAYADKINESKTIFTKFYLNHLDLFITVSPTYLSQIKPLLFDQDYPSTGIINGILFASTRDEHLKKYNEKILAKRAIQKKYFNQENNDNDNTIIFSFVGRYARQKGIDVLIDAMENILKNQNLKYNVQFIIGGYFYNYAYEIGYSQSNAKQYIIDDMNRTLNKMNNLMSQYPKNFWAHTGKNSFADGMLLNRGSDFGLVPSRYEPCGLVQQEFFVAETPVIASDEGGLHDTVFEDEERRNGILIKQLNVKEVEVIINQAIHIYLNEKEKYQKMCRNALKYCVDMEKDTVKQYAFWIDRMCGIGFFEKDILEKLKNQN